MKTRWTISLVLIGIVLVSVAAGAILGAKLTERAYKRRHTPETWNQSVMRALRDHLKLTPGQAPKVQKIVDGGVEEMKGLRLEMAAKTDAVIDRLVSEVNRELTPEQQAELQKLKAQHGATAIDIRVGGPRKP
jgi:Spy/CpxP family protein refolding chaperone